MVALRSHGLHRNPVFLEAQDTPKKPKPPSSPASPAKTAPICLSAQDFGVPSNPNSLLRQRPQPGAVSDPVSPIPRLPALMGDCKDLRPIDLVFFVNDRVRKPVEVVDAKAIFAVWATLLVFDKQIANALEFSQERCRDQYAGMCRVVQRRIAELGLGIGVNRVGQAILARTRARASSPGTMATSPLRTSSRR